LRSNLIANFAGRGWSALLNLACVPFYIHLMGAEAFGLVGVYLALQVAVNVLDLGLSATMNREMARFGATPDSAVQARDFVSTVEVGYWAVGLLIGLVVWSVAPFIAVKWVHPHHLSQATVVWAIRAMGVVLTLEWPLTLYMGGLQGLERQVLLNGVLGAASTLRYGGTVLVLWLVAPTVGAFFVWQATTAAVRTGAVGICFWRSLPRSGHRARFRKAEFRRIWRFAAGLSGITVEALILTQLDKIVLSRKLSLEAFGYYTVAWTAAGGLNFLITPLFSALFPRFSALIHAGREDELKRLYHNGAQLMSVVILPAAAVFCLFTPDIIFAWTGSHMTSTRTYEVARLLMIGNALNGLVNIPYAAELASGWTSLGLYVNALIILFMVPSLMLMVSWYGAIGAGIIWILVNATYPLAEVPIMHRRLLRGEAIRWYLGDVGAPLAAAATAAIAIRLILPDASHPLDAAFHAGVAFVASLAVCAIVTPATRSFLRSALAGRRAPFRTSLGAI